MEKLIELKLVRKLKMIIEIDKYVKSFILRRKTFLTLNGCSLFVLHRVCALSGFTENTLSSDCVLASKSMVERMNGVARVCRVL